MDEEVAWQRRRPYGAQSHASSATAGASSFIQRDLQVSQERVSTVRRVSSSHVSQLSSTFMLMPGQALTTVNADEPLKLELSPDWLFRWARAVSGGASSVQCVLTA